jgi:hypothetical protein
MSKGTKQIRTGRIASIIFVLETKLSLYTQQMEEQPEGKPYIQPRIDEIKATLLMLEEAIK